MARFVVFLVAVIMVLVGVLVWWGDASQASLSASKPDIRGWLLGDRLPRLETDVVRLEEGQKRSTSAMGERISSLEHQVEELKTLVVRLEGVESAVARLESGAVSVRQDDGGWQLANIFTRVREFRQRVEFAKPFTQPPRVMMGIVMLDFNQEKIRFQSSAEAIDSKGFTVLFSTRAEERPREVRVEWLAFGR
ncbi:MAG: H-type lectin domain-containing protein [Magnetococcales bacterium]|nr:H-type lectin domain-containing protein [Magnetococcales bacterium]